MLLLLLSSTITVTLPVIAHVYDCYYRSDPKNKHNAHKPRLSYAHTPLMRAYAHALWEPYTPCLFMLVAYAVPHALVRALRQQGDKLSNRQTDRQTGKDRITETAIMQAGAAYAVLYAVLMRRKQTETEAEAEKEGDE